MRIVIFITSFLVFWPAFDAKPAHAQNAAFERWVQSFWPEARKKGISKSTFQRAFKGVTPDPDVIKKAEHQPEFAKPIWE